jgi:hypothetical protein
MPLGEAGQALPIHVPAGAAKSPARCLSEPPGRSAPNPLSAPKPSVTLLSCTDLTRVGGGSFVFFA